MTLWEIELENLKNILNGLNDKKSVPISPLTGEPIPDIIVRELKDISRAIKY